MKYNPCHNMLLHFGTGTGTGTGSICVESMILIHFDTHEPGNELSIETIVNDDDANRNWTHNLTWNFLITLQYSYDLLGGVLNNIAINWLWQVHDKRSWRAERQSEREKI